MRLLHKSAIVTGAASGLGALLARRLAEEGCDVLLADMSLDSVRAVADTIERETGQRTGASQTNVASETDVREMVDDAVRAFGKLDILVACAAIHLAHDIVSFPLSEWQTVLDINLTGCFLCAQAAARAMIPNHSGTILQVSTGGPGVSGSSATAASQSGSIGLIQSLARELAPHSIRVNAVCSAEALSSEDIAETIIRLASGDASFETGQAVAVPDPHAADS